MADEGKLTRRELIQIGTAAVAVGAPQGTASEPALKFFTRDEFAILDELTELIIPTDEHSPGARAAGVARYLDGRLAASVEEDRKKEWHDGLKRIDTLSHEMHAVPFLHATSEQRVAVLSRILKNEANPQTPDEKFLVELKFSTADAYYSSKIGIHQELEYKGNVLLQEFVGYEVT